MAEGQCDEVLKLNLLPFAAAFQINRAITRIGRHTHWQIRVRFESLTATLVRLR